MDRQAELRIIRAAYARQILAARVDDPRLEAAFGAVRREDFLGPGPWPIMRWLDEYWHIQSMARQARDAGRRQGSRRTPTNPWLFGRKGRTITACRS